MKKILLTSIAALFLATGTAHAGTVYIPTITYESKGMTGVSLWERLWDGKKPEPYTHQFDISLDAEPSFAACEVALHKELFGYGFPEPASLGIINWKCVPFNMPTPEIKR